MMKALDELVNPQNGAVEIEVEPEERPAAVA